MNANGIAPPCTCRPTNINNMPPPNGPYVPPAHTPLPGKIRPPRVYSLDASIPNIFKREAPDFVLQWTSSSNRPDPTKQKTPKKRSERP